MKLVRILLTPFIYVGLVVKCTAILIYNIIQIVFGSILLLFDNSEHLKLIEILIGIPGLIISSFFKYIGYIFLGLIRLITKYIPYGSKTLNVIFTEQDVSFEGSFEIEDYSEFTKKKQKEIINENVKEEEYEIIEENEVVN